MRGGVEGGGRWKQETRVAHRTHFPNFCHSHCLEAVKYCSFLPNSFCIVICWSPFVSLQILRVGHFLPDSNFFGGGGEFWRGGVGCPTLCHSPTRKARAKRFRCSNKTGIFKGCAGSFVGSIIGFDPVLLPQAARCPSPSFPATPPFSTALS